MLEALISELEHQDLWGGQATVARPVSAATRDGTVPPSPLPAGLTLLASGQYDGVGPGADIVCYDHPGGGFVFSVGSITFGGI